MKKFLPLFILITAFATVEISQAQQTVPGQQFRLAEGIVRIAEPGELSDLVNLWGDVNAPGRYSLPRGTTLPELISYARGPSALRSGDTTIDWSKIRIEVNVSRTDGTGDDELHDFTYRYNERAPAGMREFVLKEEDIISIEVKRRANLRDYLGIIGPIASVAATTLLLIDRF